MSAPNFFNSRRVMGPSWLTEGEGGLVGATLDILKNALVERTRQGLLVRFPFVSPTDAGPDDALAAMGRDRRIVRGINEPSTNYANRLLRWLDDWKTAGNPFALMKQLAGYMGTVPGSPAPAFRTVDVRGNWYSLDSDGSRSVLINQANWDWDAAPDALVRWARFWVIIYPNGVWIPAPTFGHSAGDTFGGVDYTWGTSATLDEVTSVRGIIADWKPAGTRCANIIIAFDDASFDPTTARDAANFPDGKWGHWSKRVGQVRTPARLSTARYWDGV